MMFAMNEEEPIENMTPRKIEMLWKAAERDPGFARALLGIGDAYGVMATDGYVRPGEAWPLAEEYTRRALAAGDRPQAAPGSIIAAGFAHAASSPRNGSILTR